MHSHWSKLGGTKHSWDLHTVYVYAYVYVYVYAYVYVMFMFMFMFMLSNTQYVRGSVQKGTVYTPSISVFILYYWEDPIVMLACVTCLLRCNRCYVYCT